MASERSSGITIGVFQNLCEVAAGDRAIVAAAAEKHGFDPCWLPEHAAILVQTVGGQIA